MLKKIVSSICFLLVQQMVPAQVGLPVYPDSLFSTYYHQRATLFRSMPQTKGEIIFLGNSITDGGEWSELFGDKRIKNRGISGDITPGVIHRIDEVAKRKPAKIFLLIGTNDLARNIAPDSIVKNILLISSYLRRQTPATKVYVQSILPVNNTYGKFGGHTNKPEQIAQVNTQLKAGAATNHYTYIDLHTAFSDENEKLKASLTNDGLHLKGNAYLLWKHILYPYVYDLQTQPALIPQPVKLQWGKSIFPLYKCKTILVKDDDLQEEAERLQQYLQQKGFEIKLAKTVNKNEPFIELRLDKSFTAPQLPREAYSLHVGADKIIITANTPHGIFNGLQTLYQLMRDGAMVGGCEIVDWPAFSWRGYMVDAGRNYQSMHLLKQQIDIMAKYKLNVFHFHPTEDIAWRIAIKQYPQLTAPENMLRDKGMYYSEADIKELIAYCKERHITFVPEIDMPGHSAAFTRAMKTDMQSDSGLAIVKNILKAFCATYDLPYLHIGGDEVHITNKNFLPQVIQLAHQLGKKTIGWSPGGNIGKQTIRQLWMGNQVEDSTLPYIDSRHLYINHMDPLEAVVTIFNRQIADKIKGNDIAKGATLCLWHDRKVANEDDVLKMNAVYPAMLAFAERSWRGGGVAGWVATIGEPGSEEANAFSEFENRLLDQRQQNFSQLPFPYLKQSSTTWKLYGPYSNAGDLSKKYAPENKNFDSSITKTAVQVVGGTIILRHWWAPLIKGILADPKENTTWYATTQIWRHEEKMENFWIGFNNLSRSPATDSPMPHTWDNHQSRVWVNGKLIDPPQWKRGGQKGNSEIPLTDEGYEYREPTKILLQKGWNTVLIKAPIGSFKGKDWQNPEKWMFTFIPVTKVGINMID